MTVLFLIIQALILPAAAPLGVGVIRKTKAKLQNREGANIVQPYRDLWKLFHKDEVISRDASWIFRFAPLVVFVSTVAVSTMIPIVVSSMNRLQTGDLLLVIYTLSVGTFFLALAGLDVGSAFGGFGASREMTVAALAEGGLIFSFVTMALIDGTANPFVMVGASTSAQTFLPVILAGAGFFIILLAETSRYPFDNPSTHLELTMIHEAMILEYSGKRLALMEWAAANKLLIFVVFGANIFLPWGIPHQFTAGALLSGFGALIVKLVVIYTAIAVLESSMAKYRFFRLPDLLLIAFILNVVAIVLL